jgi:hypothetical protein
MEQRNASPERRQAIRQQLSEYIEKVKSGAAEKERHEERAAFEAKAKKHPVLYAESQRKAAELDALGPPATREEAKRRRDEMNAAWQPLLAAMRQAQEEK